jgi:hypothetical protein
MGTLCQAFYARRLESIQRQCPDQVYFDPEASIPTPPSAQAQPSEAELEANKRVVMEFYRPSITDQERYGLLHGDYVQHNPVFKRYGEENSLTDYEAFRAFVVDRVGQGGAGCGNTASAPQPPAGNPLEAVIGRCDIVTIIHKNFRQGPTAPAKTFYETFS